MDVDDESEGMQATSSTSSVEQPSPESTGQEGTMPSEQEVVVNGILSGRLTRSHSEDANSVAWKPTQRSFTAKNKNGEKLFTAVVDGIVEVSGVEFLSLTMEMKKGNRYSSPDYAAALQAQEACQMAAAVCNLPEEKIEKLRKSSRLGRHVTVGINRNEYWFVILEYSAAWADYIRGKQAAFSGLAKITNFGPHMAHSKPQMDEFTIITDALSEAATEDNLEGFDDDVPGESADEGMTG
ncbi:uncharacterized protein F4812DRAFT_462486 [Daldinia caldariorum]|uniref:uncharacterized protein n=1 Tax=Daldinia caldariorum TaxID=326644 RepID=UPI002007A039|nr:uncharacterized protein F4812DRAFT_462486 [Daldinia caldariorum]KAI1464777.1 hypothetical protein F4812DRAFT_462486 [Daldinia caldariorum]